MFEKYCLGVDVSHWQAAVDWPRLAQAGVQFAIVKVSQSSYGRDPCRNAHLKNAAAAGMICGVYHWFDPGINPQLQLKNLEYALAGLDFQFMALDVEQYWREWDLSLRAEKNNHFSAREISDGSRAMAEAMRQTWAQPVLIYTRTSFVNEYATEMKEWLPKWPLWLAHYPYNRTRISLGWQTLKEKFIPPIPGPALPSGSPDWKVWQFSGDKFILPGSQTALDLNFFHGSRTDLQNWLGQSQTTTALSSEEKIKRLWQAHPQLWRVEENTYVNQQT